MLRELTQTRYAARDDAQLVIDIQQRSAESVMLVEELLRRHHAALLQRCQRCLHNRHDAEDAVQETELRMIRGIGAFKGESTYRTWLFAIADNQCRTLLDRRVRNLMGEHLQAMWKYAQISDQIEHQDHADRQDLRLLVAQVLNSLPVQSSEILSLRFYTELCMEEIAQLLGIGLSAAKMRLNRSLRQAEAQYLSWDRRLCA